MKWWVAASRSTCVRPVVKLSDELILVMKAVSDRFISAAILWYTSSLSSCWQHTAWVRTHCKYFHIRLIFDHLLQWHSRVNISDTDSMTQKETCVLWITLNSGKHIQLVLMSADTSRKHLARLLCIMVLQWPSLNIRTHMIQWTNCSRVSPKRFVGEGVHSEYRDLHSGWMSL